MDKTIGKEYPSGPLRSEFIKDNADQVVEKGYMRQFTDDEIIEKKSELSEIDIELNDIEDEIKEFRLRMKTKMTPLKTSRAEILKNIKQRSEFIKEPCYKYVDFAAREVGFYNSDGDLIESRTAHSDELQKTIFNEIRTGTNP